MTQYLIGVSVPLTLMALLAIGRWVRTILQQLEQVHALAVDVNSAVNHRPSGDPKLYDMVKDPNEWTNLANQPEHVAVVAEHKKWLPKIDVPPAPNSASRVLTYDRQTDEAVWEGKTVKRSDPIPE